MAFQAQQPDLLTLFLKGLGIGLSIAAPVGPIGVLCIRRSLANGMVTGFTAGMGAATADAAYGCVAAFGLTAISGFLVGQKFWLGLLGGIFLVYLGFKTFISKPAEKEREASGQTLPEVYVSVVTLTLTNPSTIMAFVGVFAAAGLGEARRFDAASLLVLGVFLGSAAWWLFLSGSVALLRCRVTPVWMQWVNRLSGAFLMGFGLVTLLRIARA